MRLSWKERLAAQIPAVVQEELDAFELELELRRQGKLDEKVFAESRLRQGAYGQRYDHGRRHDGTDTQDSEYPEVPTKGPSTCWDAPGMQRIKLPWGGVSPDQLEVLAEVAEEYADGYLHVTTRQDVQLHYVHIEDTPDLMRRLAASGVTTKEACGNTVRNVTACPYAGVCGGESFDVTAHAEALARFLLGHPDAQDFGRKFKIAFSGCAEEACGLATMHDLGFIAKIVEGRRGFEVWAGGGLGAVPYRAQVLFDFLPEAELLPVSQAVARIFGRLGEKKARHKARLKFLVAKIGIDELRRLVEVERAGLTPDPRWTAHLAALDAPSTPAAPLVRIGGSSEGSGAWRRHNLRPQRQPGYYVVTVALPLGDLGADQVRGLAEIGRRYSREPLRTTVEQNIVLRWIAEKDLGAVESELAALGLAEPTAGTLVDVTACPGTDTCKLGIASSRGLAAELRTRLSALAVAKDEAVERLRIKVSGCFNSCGQHHVADLGFYGVSRKMGDHVVPHFQVVLGGMWLQNAGAFGLALGAVPAKRIPEVVDRILGRYLDDRQDLESFHAWSRRFGKAGAKALLQDLIEIPSFAEAPELYTDWGDARVYSLKDHGVGECAGAVVSAAEFGLKDGERQVFEAQLRLEAGALDEAAARALRGMLTAARALVELEMPVPADQPAQIVREFRARLHDTARFHDPFAGGRFAAYLFRAHEEPLTSATPEAARQRVEEAQLFIEAAHAYYVRRSQGQVS